MLTAAAPGAAAPAGPGGSAGALPGATSTNSDVGRQLADAQFTATLQGFNRAYQGLPPSAAPGSSAQAKKDEDEPGFFGRVSRAIFGSKKSEPAVPGMTPSVYSTLKNINYAMQRFAVANNFAVPDISMIYDWKSLRRVVNQYGKTSLPGTEAEAGFSFVSYKPEPTKDGYTLLLDIKEPEGGVKRIEINERVNKS